MTNELVDAYHEICDQLQISPVSVDQVRATSPLPLQLHGAAPQLVHDSPIGLVLAVGDTYDTWALLRHDRRDGCADCLASIPDFLSYFYDGFESQDFDNDVAVALISLFARHHDVSLALTNAYGPQNWSVVRSVATCETCHDDGDIVAIEGSTRVAAAPQHAVDATGGYRVLSAADFVQANRWVVGFASLVGNPVGVDESEDVALVNAPVRTALSPADCEISGGKGYTFDQSLASFVGEGLERYALARALRTDAVIGTRRSVANAVDLEAEFGLPSVDAHESLTRYHDSLSLEWLPAVDVDSGRTVALPANFIFCPYSPPAGAASIVAASTNGAATGANETDATRQALLELVERDAFWFYARTGMPAVVLEDNDLPKDVRESIASQDGQFTVCLLPNPFGVPVANVAMKAGKSFLTRTARGSGASANVDDAVRRAYAECIQMLHSLDSAIDVEYVDNDMRHIWFTGAASDQFPNLFGAVRRGEHTQLTDLTRPVLEHILSSASTQGIRAYVSPLLTLPGVAVVKAAMTGIAVADATYFESNDRLLHFSQAVGLPTPHVSYNASLFM